MASVEEETAAAEVEETVVTDHQDVMGTQRTASTARSQGISLETAARRGDQEADHSSKNIRIDI